MTPSWNSQGGLAVFRSPYPPRIPIGGWMTWNDRLLEGSGVSPDVEARPSMATLRAGQDVALQRAIELL